MARVTVNPVTVNPCHRNSVNGLNEAGLPLQENSRSAECALRLVVQFWSGCQMITKSAAVSSRPVVIVANWIDALPPAPSASKERAPVTPL